jgi:hypothetical protein
VSKINLSALARSQALAASHPVEGDVEEDDDIEEQEEGIIGRRGVDLSMLDLKADHAARPLWVDENGHMYVISVSCPLHQHIHDVIMPWCAGRATWR